MIEVSVIVPTHNQRPRLSLVLAGLSTQSVSADCREIIVVDDGSSDDTAEVLERCEMDNLRLVRLSPNRGRSAARNAGAGVASGRLLVFLDGDALPAPDLLERYLEAAGAWGTRAAYCGHQYSLPDLEYLEDPAAGEPVADGIPSVLHDFLSARRARLSLTPQTVAEDFASVRRRARPGGYPFPESAERQRQARELLDRLPDAPTRWLAFVPHNAAVGRDLLLEAQGFDEEIPFSEGWELAYRLQHRHGAAVRPVQADSFHLYHRHDFDDPEAARIQTRQRYQAVEHMAAKHTEPRLRLLYFWMAALWPDPFVPEEALIDDLIELDVLYRTMPPDVLAQYELLLQRHPLIYPIQRAEVCHEEVL